MPTVASKRSADAVMAEMRRDQVPDSWSAGVAGYEAMFEPFTGGYADAAVDLLGIGPTHAVLDVAAGAGALALRAGRRGAAVLATEFAPGMVERLAERFAAEGLDRCRAEVMDGQALTVADGSFDACTSMFGLIFFPDLDAGVHELARAARPGGTVCVGTWHVAQFPLATLVAAALGEVLDGFAAPPGPPTWARLGDVDSIAAHLTAAGLVDVEVVPVRRRWVFDDPEAFFRSQPSWSPPVQPLFDGLDDDTIDRAAEAFAAALARTGDVNGLDVEALLGVGRST